MSKILQIRALFETFKAISVHLNDTGPRKSSQFMNLNLGAMLLEMDRR